MTVNTHSVSPETNSRTGQHDNPNQRRTNMKKVISKDGTTIAFDHLGEGPAVILVCGASTDRMANAPLAALLASHFTVFNYDRRGRGDSSDTAPYAVEREVEDLEALIKTAGGSAFVYGISSGAALALEAASELAITKLALYEPPFFVDNSYPRPPADLASRYEEFIAAGRRGDAVEFFMAKVVGLPAEFVAQARSSPWWPAQEALAHTLAYDATIMGDSSLPTERAASVTVPTLVIASEASFPFMRATAQALADVLPHGQTRILAGQEHNVSPEALVTVLKEFFAS
jgi:pimeloyl-ACP methyl ester carboxylesterase